jgi:hypothetical protein
MTKMTFEDFKSEYTMLLKKLIQYKPDTVGHFEYSEKLGKLVDSVPKEWEELVDNDCELV